MAWIELHQSVVSHRRTLDLSDELGVPVVTVVGHLACLWLWALDNAPDGGLAGIKPRTVARAAQWEGDPDAFAAALCAAGYVEPDGRLHDWDDYAGRLIDQRTRNAEKQKRWREAHKPVTSLPIDSARNGDVTATYPSRTAATVPNRTQPNQTQPATPNGVALAPDADAPDAIAPPDVAPAPLARSAPKPQRARDRIFDAFLAIFAGDDDSFVTDAERGKWNAAAKGFRTLAARKGIAEEQMAALICEAHEHWPNVKGDVPETPNGLLTNFSTLLRGPQVNGRSAGTVRRHEQKVTESALLLADGGLRAAREARDAHRRLIDHGGN